MVFADSDGRYRSEGLPPGDYRVLATILDFTEIDEAALDEGLAVTIRAEASQKSGVGSEPVGVAIEQRSQHISFTGSRTHFVGAA